MALTILSIEIDPDSTLQNDVQDHDLRVVLQNATVNVPGSAERRRLDVSGLARLKNRAVNRRAGRRLRVKGRV